MRLIRSYYPKAGVSQTGLDSYKYKKQAQTDAAPDDNPD